MDSDGEHWMPTPQETTSMTATGATGVTSCRRMAPGPPSPMRGGRVLCTAYSERDMRVADVTGDVVGSTARPHSSLSGGATGNGDSTLSSHSNETSSSSSSQQSPLSADDRGWHLNVVRRALSSSLSFHRRDEDEAIRQDDALSRAGQAAKHARVVSDPSAFGSRPTAVQRQPEAAAAALLLPRRRPGSELAVDEAGIPVTPTAAAAVLPPASAGGSGEPARPASSIVNVNASGSGSGGYMGGSISCVDRSNGTDDQDDSTTLSGSGVGEAALTSGGPAPPPAAALPGAVQPSGDAAPLPLAEAVPEATALDQDRGRWSRLLPSYRQRSDEFRKLFKGVPEEERLLVDYSCALKKDFLVHGRLYVSQNRIGFYANLFGWESTICIPLHEITAINKCRTAKVIPNAIQITTAKDRFLFSSFVARDQTYLVIFKAWICALTDRPISGSDLWALVRWLYGAPQEVGHSGDKPHIASEAIEELLPSENGSGGLRIERESLERSHNEIRNTMIGDVEPLAMALNGTTMDHSHHSSSSSSSSSSSRGDRSRSNSSGSSCIASDEPEVDENHDAVNLEEGSSTWPALEACPAHGHEHRGVQMLDSTFNLPAHELFALLFTDSPFFADFLAKRATSDLALSSWPESLDADGKKQRKITYTLAINASFGPKRSPATEVQIALPETVPGRFYAVDCECLNSPTLPYGENFYVLNKYCILHLSSASCRLLVHSDVMYIKPVFSIVKGIIQRNVTAGVKDYLHQLNDTLLAEARQRGLRLPAATARQDGAAGRNRDDGPLRQRRRRSTAAEAGSARAELSRGDDDGEDKRSEASPGTKEGRVGPGALQEGLGPEQAKSQAAASATVGAGLKQRRPQCAASSAQQCSIRRRLLLNAALFLLLAANILMFCQTWWLDVHLEPGDVEESGASRATPDEAEAVREHMERHQRSHNVEAEHWRELFESSSDMIYRLQRDIEELRNLVTARRNQSQVSG